MRDGLRLRIQAAGRFTPPAGSLSEQERVLVFRAVQAVIEADGFLAQPGADLLMSLREELQLHHVTDFGPDLTADELRGSGLSAAAKDYLCYMVLLSGFADGVMTDGEREVIDGLCAALDLDERRRVEIQSACQRAILEATILMNLPEVISSSDLAQRYCRELGLDGDSLEQVADAILQSLAEA